MYLCKLNPSYAMNRFQLRLSVSYTFHSITFLKSLINNSQYYTPQYIDIKLLFLMLLFNAAMHRNRISIIKCNVLTAV